MGSKGAVALECRGLTKAFGDVQAVDSLDVSVPAGQVLALVGPSGCGKTTILEAVLGDATFPPKVQARIAKTARRLVEDFRKKGAGHGPLDAFLHEYKLSDREGVVLMCLAEALLRIPDAETADRLIHDKLTEADWGRHLGQSE